MGKLNVVITLEVTKAHWHILHSIKNRYEACAVTKTLSCNQIC